MKLKLFTAIALSAMALISCEDNTGTLGSSVTENNDKLDISTQSFNILTRSIVVDSVLSRERNCYFGMVKDPETDTYVKSEFTTQFNMIAADNETLPSKENILSTDENGQITADSCIIFVQFNFPSSIGDTLQAMKMRLLELDKPITDTRMHYSNYDPKAEGLVRQDGIKLHHMFSLSEQATSSKTRWTRIHLNDPYTAKDGTTYNNYGSYLLRSYYDHPEYFKNTFTFVNNVCPGFFFELYDGVGVMAKIAQIDLYTYYHYNSNGEVRASYLRTTSTEEVIQTTKVTNDRNALEYLATDNSCTYLKTPSGIFTEVELPVSDICTSHTTDSLLQAKVSFSRINNVEQLTALTLAPPQKLLLIEKDSLKNFFEGNRLHDNTYAFRTTLASNAYSFDNISNMITRMNRAKTNGEKSDPDWVAKHPNWNKALLVPVDEVTVTSTTSSSSYYYGTTTTSSETAVALKNQMGLSSTRLIRGTAESPIKIDVIYAKFRH